MCRRSERTRRAVERAGCEREPQSGRELDERLHGWPFCGDGEDESEQGWPEAGTSAVCPSGDAEAAMCKHIKHLRRSNGKERCFCLNSCRESALGDTERAATT